MRTTFLLAALAGSAVLLGACSTTSTDGQAGAGVEERKPAAGSDAQNPRVATVDLTSKPGSSGLSALKDPNNILSKRSIYYDYDKFDVKDEYRPLVEAHAKYLRENPGAKMLIQGNTDERGGREYNVALGQRRSDGVKRMLMLLGAKDAQIEAVSLGEEKPQATGSDEGAWAKNRRSDMLYGGEF
jgi:peptidoglycan-associated lipoprotein